MHTAWKQHQRKCENKTECKWKLRVLCIGRRKRFLFLWTSLELFTTGLLFLPQFPADALPSPTYSLIQSPSLSLSVHPCFFPLGALPPSVIHSLVHTPSSLSVCLSLLSCLLSSPWGPYSLCRSCLPTVFSAVVLPVFLSLCLILSFLLSSSWDPSSLCPSLLHNCFFCFCSSCISLPSLPLSYLTP